MTQIHPAKPQVSIIMAAFNCEHYVEKAVTSILCQSYEHFELLICDDCSTDRTLSIINKINDPRVRIFRNKQNLGYLKTVNELFGLCVGKFITFQDADDWSETDRVEKLLHAFDQDSELAACGSQCTFITGDQSSKSSYPLSYEQIREDISSGENAVFCGASLMVRRIVLEEIGIYDEGFDRIGSEDLDWYLRIFRKLKVINVSDPLYNYRKTADSITRKLNLSPLTYHSSDIALALNSFDSTKTMSKQERGPELELLKQKYLGRYEKDSSRIFFVAGLHQLAIGNTAAYFWCGNQLLNSGGLSLKYLRYMISFLPGFFFGLLNERTKKKIFRLVKKIRRNAFNK